MLLFMQKIKVSTEQLLGKWRYSMTGEDVQLILLHSCGQPINKFGVSALFQCSNGDAWSWGNEVIIKRDGRFWKQIRGEGENKWLIWWTFSARGCWMSIHSVYICSEDIHTVLSASAEKHLLDNVCYWHYFTPRRVAEACSLAMWNYSEHPSKPIYLVWH